MDAFFKSQFGYFPLTWIFYVHMANNKITKPYERCLMMIFSNRFLSYEELLEKVVCFVTSQKLAHPCYRKFSSC